MSSRSYLPTRDADLANWGAAFETQIGDDAAGYGLDNAIANTITAKVDAFRNALAIATNPATRTKATVAAKDAAKADMLDTVRPYVQLIKKNNGVSNEAKTAAGVPIADTLPTPVPAPITQPLLEIIGATPLQHTVRYADASTPDKRAKPPGASGLQLFKFVGTAAPTGPADASFVGFFGRQPIMVDHESGDVGKQAYYIARWQNPRGDVGPWSGWVHMTIAG